MRHPERPVQRHIQGKDQPAVEEANRAAQGTRQKPRRTLGHLQTYTTDGTRHPLGLLDDSLDHRPRIERRTATDEGRNRNQVLTQNLERNGEKHREGGEQNLENCGAETSIFTVDCFLLVCWFSILVIILPHTV